MDKIPAIFILCLVKGVDSTKLIGMEYECRDGSVRLYC